MISDRRLSGAIAVYLVIVAALGLINVFLFPAQSRAAVTAAYSHRDYVGSRLQSAVDGAVSIGRIGAIVIGLVALSLSVATLRARSRWVYQLDFVILLLGAIGGIGALRQLARSSDNPLPGQPWLNIAIGAGATVLAAWMGVRWLRSRSQGRASEPA